MKKILATALAATLLSCSLPAMDITASKAVDGTITQLPDYVDISLPEDGSSSGNDNRTALLGEGALPSKYMTSLTDLVLKYPGTRDQGSNGMCWAYTSVAMSELSMINAGKADRGVDYSELQLAYFTSHSRSDASEDYMSSSGDDFMKSGGNMYYAMHAMANQLGVVDEQTVPMSGANSMVEDAKSGILSDEYATSKDVAHLENAYITDPSSKAARDATKTLIKNFGGVGIGFCMRGYDEKTNSVYSGRSSAYADHAVVIVGWDDSKETKASENGAWLARNSWTVKTGMNSDSYFWIPYTETSILNEGYAFEMSPVNDRLRLYSYDGLCSAYPYVFGSIIKNNERIDVEKVCRRASNVFTAKSDESLEAVSISSDDAGLGYSIRVYLNPTSSSPESGTLADTTSGSTEYAGINRISLSKSVSVKKGDRFAVVVELTENVNAGLNFEYGLDQNDLEFCDSMATIPKNSSYVYLGGKWYSMSDIVKNASTPRYGLGNVCIKAYTLAESSESEGDTEPEESGGESGGNNDDSGKTQESQEESETQEETKTTKVSKQVKVIFVTVTNYGKKSITIKWKKTKNTTGYQVYRRKGSSGKWQKVKTNKGAGKVSFKNTGLKRKTKYYYKVRAYRTVSGKTYYGKFSNIVNKKTK